MEEATEEATARIAGAPADSPPSAQEEAETAAPDSPLLMLDWHQTVELPAKEEATAPPAGGEGAASCTGPAVETTRTASEDPRLRLDWKETIVHGLESNNFTIEVHHGGYFVGLGGKNAKYFHQKGVVWFDHLDRTKFNIETIYVMIRVLGYKALKLIFWYPPGKTVDELVEIVFPKHCDMMAKASVESKVLVLFLHEYGSEKLEQDDVCNEGPELPDIIFCPPCKSEHKIKSEEGNSDSSEDSEKEDLQDDSDVDPGWYDSDYDMKEDDCLFDENVDDSEADEMVEKGKQIAAKHAYVPGLDDVNEAELLLPAEDDSQRRHKSDSDDEEYKKKKKKKQAVYKLKPFNSAGDMEDPQFKLGMEFDSVELLRTALSQYAIKERIQIKKTRNNQKRLEAHCGAEGCKWKMVAVKDNRSVAFLIKIYVGEHTCEKVWEVKEMTARFLALQFVEMFRDYVVELNLRGCSCRRWQLTGIPCSHAIACLRHERRKPESMVSSCYSVVTYLKAYGGQVFPLRDKDEWEAVDATPILPPLYEKYAGRRKKNRRKQPEESSDGTRLSKHGAIMHCGHCREPGHNRAGCAKLKAAIIRENEVAQDNDLAADYTSHDSVQQEHQHAPDFASNDSQQPSVKPHGKGPATQEEGTNTSRKGRKRKQTNKMKEHVEHLMEMVMLISLLLELKLIINR